MSDISDLETVKIGTTVGHDHRVEFYDTESFLVDIVCAFFAPSMRSGDTTIVVATVAHRHSFEAALGDAGIDVEAAASQGRYFELDAATMVDQLMVDGALDATLFDATIGSILQDGARRGRQVRVYSELAALLWDSGNVDSALALEDLWDGQAQIHRFRLLCAYPTPGFEHEPSGAALNLEIHRIRDRENGRCQTAYTDEPPERAYQTERGNESHRGVPVGAQFASGLAKKRRQQSSAQPCAVSVECIDLPRRNDSVTTGEFRL
jgi:MEDS: MEthanogen/methylotroph, DcmR Sensory domain